MTGEPPTWLLNHCGFYWGSHSCAYPRGHLGTVHRCWNADDDDPGPLSGVCCEYDEAASPDRRARWTRADGSDEWDHWEGYTRGWRWPDDPLYVAERHGLDVGDDA